MGCESSHGLSLESHLAPTIRDTCIYIHVVDGILKMVGELPMSDGSSGSRVYGEDWNRIGGVSCYIYCRE